MVNARIVVRVIRQWEWERGGIVESVALAQLPNPRSGAGLARDFKIPYDGFQTFAFLRKQWGERGG
jgi:hypothetical protein